MTGGVSVPLPTNVQREDACQILVDSGASCLVCSSAELDRLAPALCSVTRLKALIIMDAPAAACADHLAVCCAQPCPLSSQWCCSEEAVAVHGQRHVHPINARNCGWGGSPVPGVATLITNPFMLPNQASAHLLPGCRSATLEQVLQAGRAASARLPLVVPSNGEALVKLLYTSGSTGLPKGAMNTDSIWRQAGALPIGLRVRPCCKPYPGMTHGSLYAWSSATGTIVPPWDRRFANPTCNVDDGVM